MHIQNFVLILYSDSVSIYIFLCSLLSTKSIPHQTLHLDKHINVNVGLQIKANLENVTGLIPESVEDFRWYLKLKCTECDEAPDHWQYVTLSEEQPLKVKKF